MSLTELVDTCHGAENVFDNLRNGGRELTSEVMDTILQSLDTVNEQFACVQERSPVPPANPELLEALHKYSNPASADEVVEAAPVVEPEPEPEPEPEVVAEAPASGDAIAGDSVDEITDDEFDRLLDQLHGKGQGPAGSTVPESSGSAPSSGDDITDDEFEKLLDDLHGAGKGPQAGGAEPATPSPQNASVESPSSDEITDDEFEKLLDELHGKGKSPVNTGAEAAPKAAAPAAPAAPAPKPAPKAEPAAAAPPATVAKPPAKAEEKKPPAPQAEQTVRVNTSTLDTIMNMVGELVLVRNRLVSLGANSDDENMAKAVTNLDVVTADLQGAVMQTRMQPIKKVFGRFPRVVRDLARSLKKDIVLEMRGEETDLDKTWLRHSRTQWFTWCVTRLTTVLKCRMSVSKAVNRVPVR